MKAAIVILLIAAFYGLPAQSQTTKTGKATATGACAISHSGNNDTININIKNCGIGPEQGKKIIELLDKLKDDRSSEKFSEKLDQLIELASKPYQIQNCVGSNCLMNGTQNNFDQRQFGAAQPPPQITGWTVNDVDPMVIDPNKPMMNMEGPLAINPGVSISFQIDRLFQNPMFLVKCDRPCSATGAMVGGISSPQMLSSAQNPRVAGVALGMMVPLMPGNSVTIKVRSADSQKISILSVEGYVPPIQR